jgi:hypothetical protein
MRSVAVLSCSLKAFERFEGAGDSDEVSSMPIYTSSSVHGIVLGLLEVLHLDTYCEQWREGRVLRVQ